MDMFSGFTSQVTTWMGKKQEGGVPPPGAPVPGEGGTDPTVAAVAISPTASASGEPSGERKDSKTDASPTKAGAVGGVGGVGGRMEMFTSMKSQMTTWLGGAMKKGDEGAQPTEGAVKTESKPESPTSEKSEKGSPEEQIKDDDDSSEHQASEGEEAEDKDKAAAAGAVGAGLEGVSTKAIAGAKSIGSFLFSAVNKAGKTVSEAGAKIKKTVEENEAFIRDKRGKGSEAAVPPWVGYPNEENLKEEILSLSADRRNFVRDPPSGVNFEFDYESIYPVALATLAEDSNLEKMRFELVPKMISEEKFWRNYFYRVSLLRQSNELSSMSQEGGQQQSRDSSRAGSMEDAKDSYSKDVDEAQDGIKKLGMGTKNA